MGSTQREMPVIPSAEASSSTCVPVPENSCSGRAAAENSRSAPDGAERPTSSPACARDARDRAEAAPPPPVQEWRTGKRQSWVHRNAERTLPFTLQIRCAPHKGARSDQFKTVTSTEMGPGKGAWATEAAAKLAKAEFKAWVNTEMNKPKRAAAAASAVSRAAAPADAAPQLPVRFSARTGATEVHVAVSLRIDDAARVLIDLEVIERVDVSARTKAWSARSVNFIARNRERRAAALQAARDAVHPDDWADFEQRLRDLKRVDESKPKGPAKFTKGGWRRRRRGKGRGNFVGERARIKRDRHVARREGQQQRLNERVAVAHAERAQAIELLRSRLVTGQVASLLVKEEGDKSTEISPAQTSRVTTQGWAVLRALEEQDRLEVAVLDGTEKVPTGGIVAHTTRLAGEYFGVGADAVRGWRTDFFYNDLHFGRDRRGTWERELLVRVTVTPKVVLK